MAQQLTDLLLLSIMGTMVIAILLGIARRVVVEIPEAATHGINLAAESLLKLGVTLMGIRLDISQLLASGSKIILLDTFSHHFYHHLFGVDRAEVTHNRAWPPHWGWNLLCMRGISHLLP